MPGTVQVRDSMARLCIAGSACAHRSIGQNHEVVKLIFCPKVGIAENMITFVLPLEFLRELILT